tara:strand:- start:6 stop:920 length:915 start_codon:yes stop_codon:yes gene_type:complete
MKKIIAIILMLFFSAEVNAKRYKVNDVIENQFVMNKKFQLNLPEGKWTVVRSHGDNYYGLASKIYLLVRLENNLAVESIEIAEMKTAGVFESHVNQAIYEALFKNKYDGCYERPEYFVVKVYKKGSTHNCLVINHSDVHKDFFTPDDREASDAGVKKWIRDNNIQLPRVGLSSFHAYFSRLAAGKWYLLSYGIDPKILNGPKNNFISEETSEYHKNNISNYPDHQKTMQKWVSISAQRHIEFENLIKVIERHKLDLSNLSPSKSQLSKNSSNEIIDQINKLNNLYKNGILTKDEFEKAKKKILN